MIIRCDHCSARFRMDDSKLANGPVKVRCAKCKEVFVVQPEESAAQSMVSSPPEPVVTAADRAESSDFSFAPPPDSHDSFSQGADDFSLGSETRPVIKDDDSIQADTSNEFDWQTGVSLNSDVSEAVSDFNLSSFDASLATPNESAYTASVTADDSDFDFGEVDFNAATASSAESKVVAATEPNDEFSMDFGEVSFSENPVDSSSSPETFSTGPAQTDESSPADDFLLSFNPDSVQQLVPTATDKENVANVNFGDFSFGDKDNSVAAESSAPTPDPQDDVSGTFAAAGFPAEYQDEELPPSSLTSRKKSGSNFPLLVISGAIILVIALAGSGVYFFGGPKAFSRVGLGFLVEWSGDKAAEEGSIALKGVTASYAVNSAAGELFVVRGEAVNNFKKPRASIQIKVSLLGAGGINLVTKSAFCGNSLSNEQLASLPLAKLEETMNNQFGDSLANLGLKPGGTIPFIVVVSPLPKDATDYNVTVGGSTVATQ
jgi:predicted Zn finger-like uncharacterized protein